MKSEPESTAAKTEAPDKAQKLKDLEQRLAAARNRHEAARKAREKEFEVETLEEELSQEELAANDDEKLLELEREHKTREGYGIGRVNTDRHGMIVLQKPNPLMMRRFLDAGKTDCMAAEDLIKKNLLYPDKARYGVIVEAEVDTIRKCTNKIMQLHGMNMKEILPGK